MSIVKYEEPGFTVTYDMIEAGLTGNTLLIFAFLHYQTWKKEGWKKGLHALAKKFHLTVPTVIKIISDLEKNGFITKDYIIDGQKCKRCFLKVNFCKLED